MKNFKDFLSEQTSDKFETHFDRAATAIDTLINKTPEAKQSKEITKLLRDAMELLHDAYDLTNEV